MPGKASDHMCVGHRHQTIVPVVRDQRDAVVVGVGLAAYLHAEIDAADAGVGLHDAKRAHRHKGFELCPGGEGLAAGDGYRHGLVEAGVVGG